MCVDSAFTLQDLTNMIETQYLYCTYIILACYCICLCYLGTQKEEELCVRLIDSSTKQVKY